MKEISIGDAVEVRFVRYGGIAAGEVRTEAFWRPATVVAVDESGAIGAAFADCQRVMVEAPDWRAA